jgi:hypothetical protein
VTRRAIGPVGTTLRVALAVVLIYLAGGVGGGLSSGFAWHEAALGLVGFPAATVALGLAARRHGPGPVRFTGPLAMAANCAVLAALVANPYTIDAAALFYALAMLAGAWRGQAGCEVTAISNWLLRRDDRVGCPVFWPIDEAEARLGTKPEVAPRG